MKLRYIDLIKSIKPMKIISENENIPFLTAVKISYNIINIDKEINNYIIQKNDLDNVYLTKDGDNSESLTIKKGLEEIYLKELTELNEKEVEIDIKKIIPTDLSSLRLAPKYIEGITFMLN